LPILLADNHVHSLSSLLSLSAGGGAAEKRTGSFLRYQLDIAQFVDKVKSFRIAKDACREDFG
jgi:hypothetical protein